MTIRTAALDALRCGLADGKLRAQVGFGADAVSTRAVSSRILTSKVYSPDQSWTRRWSWWHQVYASTLVEPVVFAGS